MACVLKLPDDSKGIVTFTTEEQRNGVQNNTLFPALKEKWLVGLHHNWQISKHDPSFDFSMGRKEGIRPPDCPLIDMDASCFSTPEFFPGSFDNKFWDIIHVARAVEHRSIDAFMHVIRKIYDQGHKYRALLITPIPDEDGGNSQPPNVLDYYCGLFSPSERKLFNLIDITYSYPFPWDYETLAFYFRSSKIFVNPQNSRLPCRISVQAVASGLPFVTYPFEIPLTPPSLQQEPAQYHGRNLDEIATKSIKALENYTPETLKNNFILDSVAHFEYNNSMSRLKEKFNSFFESRGLSFTPTNLNLKHLDYRIARHHGMSIGCNKVEMNLTSFIDILVNNPSLINIASDDLEIELCSA